MTQKVIEQQKETNKILSDIEYELENENIYFINENNVLSEHEDFLKEYFIQKVSPALMTIVISDDLPQDFKESYKHILSQPRIGGYGIWRLQCKYENQNYYHNHYLFDCH